MLKTSIVSFNAIILAGLLGIVTPSLAAPPEGIGGGKDKGGDVVCEQGLFSPVILAREFFTPGRPVQMREDGSCLQDISIRGDLMHNRIKGERYFLTSEPVTLPDGSQRSIVVAYEESGDPNTRRVLTSDLSIDRFQPHWSIDGTRVAYVGARYDPNFGGVIERGIFVGEVIFDVAMAPDQIVNERLVVEADPNEYLIPILSWSGDRRITYATSTPVYDADGTLIAYEREIYVAEIDPSVSYEIQFADGSIEYYPSFSPVDNRLAFIRNTSRVSCYRNHVFVVDIPDGYDGTYLLPVEQITNNRNAKDHCQLGRPHWSPDGTYLIFEAWDLSLNGGMQIYTIKSDGSGKAVKLTNSKTQGYLVTGWRE